MDALIEPKDYIALSHYAIHVVEVLRCSLLQPVIREWEVLRRVA